MSLNSFFDESSYLLILSIISMTNPRYYTMHSVIPWISHANDTQYQQIAWLIEKAIETHSFKIFLHQQQNNENIHKTTKDAAH